MKFKIFDQTFGTSELFCLVAQKIRFSESRYRRRSKPSPKLSSAVLCGFKRYIYEVLVNEELFFVANVGSGFVLACFGSEVYYGELIFFL